MSSIIQLLDHGSPNQTPDKIYVHAMGEYIAGTGWKNHAVQYLDSRGWSAHSFIAPDGVNYRGRRDDQGAYHALGHNTNSLGIEFLVKGVHDYGSFLKAIDRPYLTPEQYKEGVIQVRYWMQHWGITDVQRHSDISPERKVDPGNGFPWAMFRRDIGLT